MMMTELKLVKGKVIKGICIIEELQNRPKGLCIMDNVLERQINYFWKLYYLEGMFLIKEYVYLWAHNPQDVMRLFMTMIVSAMYDELCMVQ